MLNQDFNEFIQLLNSNEVRYLVIGGYAVGAHGHPRYTKDLDVWLDASPENLTRLVHVLDQFGFGSLGIKESDFTPGSRIVQLGYPPARIDLITGPDGVEFEQCYPKRLIQSIGGTSVQFIGIDELRLNKRASGRPQDLADLAALE